MTATSFWITRFSLPGHVLASSPHLHNCIVLSILQQVRIRVCSRGKVPMPEPLLNHLQIHASRQHQRCLSMPQIMEHEGVRNADAIHGSDTRRSGRSLSHEDTRHGCSRTQSAPVLGRILRPVAFFRRLRSAATATRIERYDAFSLLPSLVPSVSIRGAPAMFCEPPERLR